MLGCEENDSLITGG